VAFGRFVKLFGNTAFWEAAIADAFRIANGFFPVKVVLPLPEPMRLLVPDDLSLSLIIFFAMPLALFPCFRSFSPLEFEEVVWLPREPELFVEVGVE
jgi:hypothetical protein